MAFVCVVDGVVDAEFLESEHTADAEEIFLLDTVFPVTAVELVGDGTVPFAVHVEVGVEKIELHAAYVHTPDVAVDDTAGERYFKNHRMAVAVGHLFDGELVEVLRLVVGDLLSVDAERLGEVAVAVEEADGGHVNAAVGCFLDVVAGKDAETAGIDLQTVAEAIFH